MPSNYSEEASVSGTQAIKKIRGRIESQERVESRFTPSEFDDGRGGKRLVQPKDQIMVKLSEAAILEMFDDAEVPELKEGEFTFWIPFAEKGQLKAHPNSPFQKCWVDTAKEVYGKPPSQLNGTFVTLDKVSKVLFSTNVVDGAGQPVLDADGKKKKTDVLSVDKQGRAKYFCFTKDEGASSADLPKHLAKIVTGKIPSAALRAILIDDRAGQFPEFKALLESSPEKFAEKIGLAFVDGKFA